MSLTQGEGARDERANSALRLTVDLASWHPSDWLTAGLVFFASVQVAVMWWTEGRRSRERHEDRLREIDRAIVTLRAESFRAFTVTRRWKNVDLFQEAVAGVLQPEEILPVDFPSVVTAGSALGPAAANICLAGLQLLEDASKLVRNFTHYASMIGGAIRYTHLGIMPPDLREDAEKRIRDLIWVAEEASANPGRCRRAEPQGAGPARSAHHDGREV